MKFLATCINCILTVIMIISETLEFLAVPAFFVIIGLFNSFPWQYYAITIGGLAILYLLAEVIAHFVFKALDKKYTPLIKRKLEKCRNNRSQNQK